VSTLTHLTHPHGLTWSGEIRYLTHHSRFEVCGCLIANVEVFGHRPGCRNTVAGHERFHVQSQER
jgi:hypothetical protein